MTNTTDFMEFMKGNAIGFDEVEEFNIPRFGKPFQLKAIDGIAEGECKEKATIKTIVNGKTKREFDPAKYQDLMIAKTVSYPNLNSAALQDSYGVKNDVDLLKIMLKAGEYIDLQTRVNEINGFTKSNELIEKAKK